MKRPDEKLTVFLQGYKEGFNVLSGLVQDFDDMSSESQEMYLIYAEQCLLEQLDMIDKKQAKVLEEVKEFLARYNSQFKALLDTEKHLKSQLEYYKQMRTVITNDERSKDNCERAAV